MNDLRTEDELRAALDALSDGAPDSADVLPRGSVRAAHRRRRLVWLAPVAVALIVVGLAIGLAQRGDHTSRPSGGGDPRDLVGVTWKVLTIDGQSPDQFLALKIEPNGRFYQGVGSCDGLQGRLRLTETELVTTSRRPSFGLCPVRRGEPAAERQTTATLGKIFRGSASWSLRNGRLTLSRSGAPTVVYGHNGRATELRQWTYHGVGISVPATWPKNAEFCDAATENTVIYPDAGHLLCGKQRAPGVSSVEFAAYNPQIDDHLPHAGVPSTVLIDGVEAREVVAPPSTRPGGRFANAFVMSLVIASRGVTVTIAAPSSEAASNLEQQLYLVHP